MQGYSKTILIGTAGKEPLTKYIQKGFSKTTFILAVDETVMSAAGQEIVQTQWHTVSSYGKLSEFAEKYIHKGDIVLAEGRLQNLTEYTENGFRYKATEILADKIEIIARSKSNENSPLPENGDEKTGSAIPGFDIDEIKLRLANDELPF